MDCATCAWGICSIDDLRRDRYCRYIRHVGGQCCHSFIQCTIESAFLVSQLAYDTVKALKLLDVTLSGCFRQTIGVLLARDQS